MSVTARRLAERRRRRRRHRRLGLESKRVGGGRTLMEGRAWWHVLAVPWLGVLHALL